MTTPREKAIAINVLLVHFATQLKDSPRGLEAAKLALQIFAEQEGVSTALLNETRADSNEVLAGATRLLLKAIHDSEKSDADLATEQMADGAAVTPEPGKVYKL